MLWRSRMPNRASAMFRLLAVVQAFLWFLAIDPAAAEEWIPDHIYPDSARTRTNRLPKREIGILLSV